MNHTTSIHCYFPGFSAECTCGWRSPSLYAQKEPARNQVAYHVAQVQGKEGEPHRPDGRFVTREGEIVRLDNEIAATQADDRAILFGGALFKTAPAWKHCTHEAIDRRA